MTATSPVRRRRGALLAAAGLTLVPLVFAGLFVTAIGNADDRLDTIPAAVVNNDEMVTTTAPDGTEQPVLAGRQLVTELTGGSAGFEWMVTNTDDAAEALERGEIYAVLEIPEDFSRSILSTQGEDPVQADLSIRTDDAHAYLTGAVVQAVGSGLSASFGQQITQQYLAGLYSGLGELGTALGDAAEGAGGLAAGAEELSGGLDELSSGAGEAATGADGLADGVVQYTDGVDQLAGGLQQLSAGATDAASGARAYVAEGVAPYTAGVDALSGGLQALSTETDGLGELGDGLAASSEGLTGLNQAIQANPAVDPAVKAGLQQIADGLAGAATGAAGLGELEQGIDDAAAGAAQASAGSEALRTGGWALVDGLDGLAGGAGDSANGAARLSDGSEGLRSGASELASGLDPLAAGAGDAAGGAGQLAEGADQLATGLEEGAGQVPATDEATVERTTEVAADPVALAVERDNEVSDIGQIVATLLVPLGLWLGALAVFLVAWPVTRAALVSSASTGRVVWAGLGRLLPIAVGQAVLLAALLHVGLSASWALAPATLTVALVMALSFTAFHYLLTVWFGRGGLVLSLLLLAVQLTSTGGLYPIEVLAEPFQWISPLLPLTHGVAAIQGILAGADVWSVVGSTLALAAFGLLSVLLASAGVRRMRRADSLWGFASPQRA